MVTIVKKPPLSWKSILDFEMFYEPITTVSETSRKQARLLGHINYG